MNHKRRKFIKKIGRFLFAFLTISWKTVGKHACKTGSDVEGPFYRGGAPRRFNIAQEYGESGDQLIVRGIVYGMDCSTPLEDVEVDIWHASPNGVYDNTSKAFLFRGKTRTNVNGHYEFKTVLPGIYQSRPRHIHYKVRHADYQELTTQLYFENDKYLKSDRTVRRNNGLSRTMGIENSDGGKVVTFDIYLS
ncbi:MAG: hypothetical protein ABJG78_20465 [Cyclobacteriaceae bacterium]